VPNLRAFVRDLRPAVTELTPLIRLLPEASEAGGPFLEETRKLVEQGPSDLRNFDPVIDAASEVTPQLNEVATDLLPIGQVLRAFQPETLGAFQNFGAATGSYDAVGHVLSTAAGDGQMGPPPSTEAAGPIGPGDCAPGFLELPFVRFPGTLGCQPWPEYEDSFLEIEPPRNP